MAMVEVGIETVGDRATVWRAVTDPSVAAEWFWPPRFATEVTLAAAPGSAWRIASPTVGMAVGGTVVDAVATERLHLTWAWEGEQRPEPTDVEVLLTQRPAGVAVTVTHRGLADGDETANHEQGWRDCLARLQEYLSRSSNG